MKTVECSKEKPWGIHPSLRDNHCPRCGWTPPGPTTLQPQQPGWTAMGGGLDAAA